MLDATGLIVAPGLIDIHVHLREPGQGYKETIATGTAAAAAGGFTAVAAMPNTMPVNDSPEITRWMQAPERGARFACFPSPRPRADRRAKRSTIYAALKSAGAVAVTDDGHPILKDSMMRETLAAAARVGLSVIQHAEDTRMTQGASMNPGPGVVQAGAARHAARSRIESGRARHSPGHRTARRACASARGAHFDRRGCGRGAPGAAQRAARHLRGRAASLPADRRACGPLQHATPR